ncbi:allophanate hydrolase [Nocardia sp. CDC153]|uniref:allophanate hydrolase n=1 Tax=Nocardia sp. CDC153 TaxID=3112167 RepID=UPI002DB8A589|nr:allophanate hydrolase [Nocardia sp. CDC153]MEC3953609.1 allophanate hydrolase [Nocardia sp. CDC153]
MLNPGPTVVEILASHESGSGSPTQTAVRVADAMAARGDDGTWITAVPREQLVAAAGEIERRPGARTLPLYGVPFGVKDSIDVAGWPTTLACPDFAYVATETAPAVQRLLDAGALFVGKTNLDQFATGLNGTRTPYPIPRSVFGGELICGGSSSGSARAVALGQVAFCVATDTAGSGRVPAALNGILGWKPSRGLISTVGLVPACKSLDCLTLMATTVADLDLVFDIVAGVDTDDPWSRERGPRHRGGRLRIGLPEAAELEFFGDEVFRAGHMNVRDGLARRGFDCVPTTLTPFLAAGELLYQGPWVAERLVEFESFLAARPDSILPVIREILTGGFRFTAVDVFRAQQRLQELKAQVARLWTDFDVVVVPTIGTTFTVAQVQGDPIATNTRLGHYTHFGNLLDLTAISVPMGTAADGRPLAVMVFGPALADDTVLAAAARLLDEPRQALAQDFRLAQKERQ